MALNKLKLIDLCAGTGAFSLALEQTQKFECVFANDIMECSKKIYTLNNPNTNFVLSDITKLDVHKIPKHDLLCCGFPCQSFSIAGKQLGFKDKRANVFWKIIDILKEHNPSYVILENVKNLKSHDDGKTFQIIKQNLKDIGYHIRTKVLDTSKVTGVPQKRERIYIVCFKDKTLRDKFHFDFADVKNKKIKELLETPVASEYYYTNRYKVFDTINENVVKTIDDNVLYQYRRYYVRENKNNCCPTLTANMGSGGHNVPLLRDAKGVRKLTPRECFNLQGFPKHFKLPELSDSALYKLAGNAVSVPVVQLIANKLASLI